MKHILSIGCFTLALLLMAVRADAEAKWTDKIEIGGSTGLDFSRHGGPGANDESVSSSHKLGFTVGGTVGYRFTPLWAAHTDISFTLKGARSSRDGMESGTYRMSYIEMPILARIYLPVKGRVGYYANIGPSLGLLLDTKFNRADGTQRDLDDAFKAIDLGLVIGAGAAIELGDKHAITFDIRYNLGLPNIDKTAAPENDDVMNRSFYFTVGYRTNLDALLGGSSGASTSPQEAPPSPELQPADAPAPVPPSAM